MAALISKDHRDYLEPEREHWTNRKGAPWTLSSAAGGVGLVAGLIVAWLTTLREGPAAVIGGLIGMLGFDFYWRWVKDTLPGRNR
jgi:hypothetical protein